MVHWPEVIVTYDVAEKVLFSADGFGKFGALDVEEDWTEEARCDMAKAIEDDFRYDKLVLETTTYNADIFPFMKEFIHHLQERNFWNRTVALVENGSWAPLAAGVMRGMLEDLKDLTFTEAAVKIKAALDEESISQLETLAEELCSQ